MLLLHGYDSSPLRVEPQAQLLRQCIGGLTVHAVQAPLRLSSGSWAWFSDATTEQAGVELADSLATLHDVARSTGCSVQDAVVAGFSQGGAVALAAGFAGICAAAICVGGFLPPGIEPGPTTTPLLLIHGADDEIVDPFYAETTARRAQKLGCEVDFHEVPGGHEWTTDATMLIVQWLRNFYRQRV